MAHNFYVGDLGFHKVINDEHPYERATAPFRKEQFDAAPTVGDQSLAGWWTRGQLSFHKGAGIKFYEVLDGEAVLDAYRSSENVAVYDPGRCQIAPAVTALSALSWVTEMVSVDSAGEHWLATTWDAVSPTELKSVSPGYQNEWDTRTVTDLGVTDASSLTASRSTAYFVKSGDLWKWTPVGGASSLWTHTVDFTKVKYAKGRLWAVTASDKWYMLSLAGGVVATSDEFGQVDGASPDRDWVLAETPSVMLAAKGNTIWAISVDESGSVPAPTPPRVVAVLPGDESVMALGYELGSVVIATAKGVRFGVLEGGTTGGLVYGPPVGPSATNGMAVTFGPTVASAGSTILLAAQWREDRVAVSSAMRYGVLAYSMGHLRDELTPAWSAVVTVAGTQSLNKRCGVVTAQDGSVVYWNWEAQTWRTRPGDFTIAPVYADTGYLDTGLHRFGTLDGKHFHAAAVRYEGTAGAIKVSRVDTDGTVTDLSTIAVTGPGEALVPLGLSSPVESVGLRFTLTSGSAGSETPVLLGYQIKALPSPVRQRLIRVPLMMFDTERGPTGRAIGAEKSAWTRYQALEDLEENDALVTYRDEDTGETGTGFIESVELIQRNGSKGVSRSNGFGGVVSVTLRKVS